MSIYAASRDRSVADVHTTLVGLVRNFETDATASRKQIRNILDNERGSFYSSAIEILKSDGDSRGAHYLIALIVSNGLLVDALCDPGLTRDQAMTLARAAIRLDSMVDAMIARRLADSAVGQSEPVHDPARLMYILAEIADASRVLPSLMRLLRHPNPYWRSKVVKIIGRGSRSVKWVKGKLGESDARVRANALEAIWGVESPEAGEVLHAAAADTNNRVAGNALLGLYFLGDTSALDDLARMACHGSHLFRSTAAWVMGETGDPRFLESLRKLLLDSEPVVRKRALSALHRLRQTSAALERVTPWSVAGRPASGPPTKGTRRALIAIAGADGKGVLHLTPLNFILTEGGRYVNSYRVAEKPEPETMCVIWVVPRTAPGEGPALAAGALSCLGWRRPSDLWCVMPYVEQGSGSALSDPQDAEAPQFTANPETLESWFQEPAKRLHCTDLAATLARLFKADIPSRGKRQIIVLTRSPQNRYGVQAIMADEKPDVAEFGRRLQDQRTDTPEETIPALIRQTYLALLTRYEIAYESAAADTEPLRLRVQTSGGWCETTVEFPPPPSVPEPEPSVT